MQHGALCTATLLESGKDFMLLTLINCCGRCFQQSGWLSLFRGLSRAYKTGDRLKKIKWQNDSTWLSLSSQDLKYFFSVCLSDCRKSISAVHEITLLQAYVHFGRMFWAADALRGYQPMSLPQNGWLDSRFSVSPGVLVLSWYPPGLADDNGEPAEDLVSSVLDAAYRHGLKVRSICTFLAC